MRTARTLCLALIGLAAPAARADVVVPLVAGGPIANRLNVAILGDGYTGSAADQAKLESDARNVLTGLFSFEPYQTYRGLFNVKLIHSVSPSSTVPKTSGAGATALGCYYGCLGIDRLVCCDGGSEGSVAAVTAANVPEATLSIVVVNDATYGGSGGPFVVVSTSFGVVDILRHELGHTLAGLADEYSQPYPGYPPCDPAADCPEPNATLYAQRPGKWDRWVAPEVCAPTAAGTEGVGYFEGCRYQSTGVFKPVSNPTCLMNALGSQFCPVCKEAVSLVLWSRARAVDSATPDPSAVVQTAGCAQQSFAVTVAANAGQLAIAWSIDAVPQPAATTATASFDTNLVAPGTHQVVATVHDTNPAIRVDTEQLATTTTTWTWQTSCPSGMPLDAGVVVPPDAPPPDAPPGACTIGDTTHPAGMPPDDGGCGVARGDGLGALIIAILAAAHIWKYGSATRVRHRRSAAAIER